MWLKASRLMVIKQIASQLHGKIGGEEDFNNDAFETAFKNLDKNGDGKIAETELMEWFKSSAIKKGVLKE